MKIFVIYFKTKKFIWLACKKMHAVKISEELFDLAKIKAKVFHRSTAGQIEYWAKMGQLVEENQDLPYSFIQDMLLAMEEVKVGKIEPFEFSQ